MNKIDLSKIVFKDKDKNILFEVNEEIHENYIGITNIDIDEARISDFDYVLTFRYKDDIIYDISTNQDISVILKVRYIYFTEIDKEFKITKTNNSLDDFEFIIQIFDEDVDNKVKNIFTNNIDRVYLSEYIKEIKNKNIQDIQKWNIDYRALISDKKPRFIYLPEIYKSVIEFE